MNTYAEATAAELLEAIPFYEGIECDMAAAAIAFMRWYQRRDDTFKVKGLPFSASNFSAIHLILSPLVRQENGRKTLSPFAGWLRMHEITDMRVVGSGFYDRRHQYSRNGGRTWGTMPTAKAGPPPAPVQHLDAPIPPAPGAATEEDLPLWEG